LKSDLATYLYCLVQSQCAPRLRPSVRGLPRTGRPRLVPAGESRWLVAADAPLRIYGEEPLAAGLKDLAWVARCALAHQEVIEGLRGVQSILPMKLFTLFQNDSRALAHLAGSSGKIRRALERVQGCEEWAARAALDGVRAASLARQSVDHGPITGGASFLLRKKQLRDAGLEATRRARRAAQKLHRALAQVAAKACQRTARPGEPATPGLLLEAAYLVPRRSAPQFRARARSLASELKGEGLRVSFTGPWPPYSFVEGGR
jgi:hypothetical protein